MTARWVVDEVAPNRDLNITWEPISLLKKNDPPEDSDYYAPVAHTHRLLRVMESVRKAEGDDRVFDFYWAAGTAIHHDENREITAAEVLEATGLDASHADAYEDESWDAEIDKRMSHGLSLVGDDVGTPIIAFDNDGTQVGFFGPVITKVPEGEDSLRLWDAFATLTTIDGLWEIKRTRTERPDFGARPA